MLTGRPVSHGFGHRIRLVPYNLAAHVPAVILQGDSHAIGDHAQIFRLQIATGDDAQAMAGIVMMNIAIRIALSVRI